MNQILSIVTNYCRPNNIPLIVDSLREQTVPVDIVVVDNSPEKPDGSDTLQLMLHEKSLWADDIWRFVQNVGPPCRMAPAFMDHSHEFIWLLDDDLLPGSKAAEHLLLNYEWVDGKCSTIGEIGRVHSPQGEYIKRNIRRPLHPRRVDMTARSHFVRTEHMRHVLDAKWQLIDRFGDEARHLVSIHDDLILCCGVQLATGFPSYLTADAYDAETLIRKQDLPDGGGGVSAKPGFLEQRHRLIQMFQAIGWESLI